MIRRNRNFYESPCIFDVSDTRLYKSEWYQFDEEIASRTLILRWNYPIVLFFISFYYLGFFFLLGSIIEAIFSTVYEIIIVFFSSQDWAKCESNFTYFFHLSPLATVTKRVAVSTLDSSFFFSDTRNIIKISITEAGWIGRISRFDCDTRSLAETIVYLVILFSTLSHPRHLYSV